MSIIWGLIIGACLGFLFAGLVSAGRDNKDYIEMNLYDKSKNDEEEVEE